MEEGPVKTNRAQRAPLSSTADGSLSSEPLEEQVEENEEEVVEEDDKFDIDDSSVESLNDEQNAMVHVQNEQITAEFARATKAWEVASQTDSELEVAAIAALRHSLTPKFSRSARSRSRSTSGLRSGVDTPGRFAGPTHSPPRLPDHYHPAFTSEIPSPTISDSSDDSLLSMDRAQRGARDDLHSAQQYFSGRSRIPRDRDFDDNLQTPTIPDRVCDRRSHPHPRTSSREGDHQNRRAFAVWGNDETDSGTSDSDPLG